MIKKLLATVAIAAMALTGAASAQAAESRIQVGLLTCDVEPGIGYIIGSSKDVTCELSRKGHRTETYTGSIKKLGLDVGFTAHSKIVWLVFAAGNATYKPHALSGTYVGASSEATFGVGVGSNWLIGGSRKAFALQPWSLQGQVGVNLSWTWTNLTLD